MKTITLAQSAALALAFTAIAAPAAAESAAGDVTPYIQASTGYAFGDAGGGGNILSGTGFGGDFGNSGSYGGGIGLKLPGTIGPASFRVDLTGSFNPSLGGSGHGGTLANGTPITATVKLADTVYLANLYADFNLGLPVTPFIGIGVGGAHKKVGNIVYSNPMGNIALVTGNDHEGVAWSATTGASYSLTANLAVELAYRFTECGKVNAGTNFVDLTQTPSVVQGLNQQISSRLELHQLNATLRYSF